MKTFYRIAKQLSALALTLMMASVSVNAQVPNDSIIADFNEFIRLLEETHPDPYTNYGGRPFFRLEAMETRLGLIEDSVTSAEELAHRIGKFLTPLEDGHTSIFSGFSSFGNDDEPEMGAPISFEAISDGVFVESIMSDYKDLLGSRLIAIEGVPFKEICDNLAQYHTAENEIGRITNFMFISGLKPSELRKAIPDMREDSVTFRILTPEGKQIDLTLPLVKTFGSNIEYSSVERTEPFSTKKNLSYLFVDDKKNTMYFRSSQIMARDALEAMQGTGMDLEVYLQRVYRAYNDDEMPQDVNEALARIPSFSDEFEKMLLEMKKNNSKNLIIDLRGNGGGYTPITIPTLYQMWGDKYLMDAPNFGIKFIQMLSPLYMKKMNLTLEQLNTMMPGFTFIPGDYLESGDGSQAPQEITDEYRNMYIGQMMSSVKDKLLAQNGKPVYTPEHVYVLTNSTTYSAAFHYMFYLWKMGATVVGLPSMQAPNTYMEQTMFELPRTGLKGSISNSLQLFLPKDDPRACQFTPDLMPTYEDYKHYNFDTNTELLYLLDYINGKK